MTKVTGFAFFGIPIALYPKKQCFDKLISAVH